MISIDNGEIATTISDSKELIINLVGIGIPGKIILDELKEEDYEDLLKGKYIKGCFRQNNNEHVLFEGNPVIKKIYYNEKNEYQDTIIDNNFTFLIYDYKDFDLAYKASKGFGRKEIINIAFAINCIKTIPFYTTINVDYFDIKDAIKDFIEMVLFNGKGMPGFDLEDLISFLKGSYEYRIIYAKGTDYDNLTDNIIKILKPIEKMNNTMSLIKCYDYSLKSEQYFYNELKKNIIGDNNLFIGYDLDYNCIADNAMIICRTNKERNPLEDALLAMQKAIRLLKDNVRNDDEIKKGFHSLYKANQIDLYQLEAISDILGYRIRKEWLDDEKEKIVYF